MPKGLERLPGVGIGVRMGLEAPGAVSPWKEVDVGVIVQGARTEAMGRRGVEELDEIAGMQDEGTRICRPISG